ncbi:KAT8 regulatory NSL complex subunit 1 [Spea bombifrons]|uniref:KAT8 regulatory NSL complex subunit 1 n=1 Tax=Spea bombifrons TaxID=233779 RepID=UPI00234A68C9|nr:KAT8 regulatory NSL complex subunit 1 [Spea bombifrons]
MAAMAPALTDPAPDARNLHFKLAPPSSSLPLGETNGGCLPPPAPPDLVTTYSANPRKEPLKLAGVFAPRSILSQSLCRGRPSILELNLEEFRGITSSGRGTQGEPLNGLAKKPTKPAVERPPSLVSPTLEPMVKAAPVPSSLPAAVQEQKGAPGEICSHTRLESLLRCHGEMEERARWLQKRLRLVQAKQVERHLHQQLGDLVGAALGQSPQTSRNRLAVMTRKAEAQRRGEAGGSGTDAFLKGAAFELEKLSTSASAALRACEVGFDSDATESSSGGDSDIEDEELGRANSRQSHVPLKRRCAWTWAQERADVVSRWNWLQAHVSDLEYRIRQHTDFYRQLRAGKGQVVLGDSCSLETSENSQRSQPPDAKPAASASSSQDAVRTERAKTPRTKSLQRPLNGVVNILPSESSTRRSSQSQDSTGNKSTASAPDGSCVCARARPLLACKRRRVVRPDRLLPLHRKAQRSVPKLCDVSPSCVMCSSFPNPPPQFPYGDSLCERLALLDPAIHPVLSFPADIPASLRFQSLLRSHNKQDKAKSNKKLKQRPSNQLPATPEILRGDRVPGGLHPHRFSLHRPQPDLPHKQHLDFPVRMLKCERSSIPRPERSTSLTTPQTKKRHFHERDGKQHTDSLAHSPALEPGLSGRQSPLMRQPSTPSDGSAGFHSQASLATARRRRTESSYDINNIVIPMSVAATTRVEKLQYKEILTPSWRVVHITPLTPNADKDVEELEDLSDAAFSALHAKCEDSERARWLTSSAPPQRRGSRTHRSSESSNPPQPSMSHSLMLQPPSPDTGSWHAIQDFSPLSPDTLSAPPTPTSRDTSRLLSEETQSSVSDSGHEESTVQPWERRHFPLPHHPKLDPSGPSEPVDWGGSRHPRRTSCGSRTAKELEGPPSSPPCPPSRPRPHHR